MRILLIEDDSATAQSIELALKSEGFNVYTTDLGEEGVDLGKMYDYDLILTEIALPDTTGFEVIRQLRFGKIDTPIMVLSDLSKTENVVKALSGGADDYVTKPFHKDELIARIHAVVRRSKGHSQSVIKTGDILVNLDTKTVEVAGNRVHLTGKEYEMLELLSLRKGATLTKEMFLNHLYGGIDEPELKIVDVFICKLRQKLSAAAGGPHHIETVWGRGYVMRDDASQQPARSREYISGYRTIFDRILAWAKTQTADFTAHQAAAAIDHTLPSVQAAIYVLWSRDDLNRHQGRPYTYTLNHLKGETQCN